MEGDHVPERSAETGQRSQAGLAAPRRLSWGLRAIEIDSLWRQGLNGAGIRAGHLDTGVAGDHPALTGRIAAFAEVDDEGRLSPAKAPRDTASHGTHTAGILCGGAIEGEAIGVAPEARLYSAAVIDGGRNVVRILQGMDWLRGSGVRVLNLSLGIPGRNPVFWTMLQALHSEGVLAVCPIGNQGPARSCHRPILSSPERSRAAAHRKRARLSRQWLACCFKRAQRRRPPRWQGL
jgi:subtilisin